MKFIYIIIFLIKNFSFNTCLFKNSKNVKELHHIEELDLELSHSNITIGMMLIYSVHCGHCHTFSKTYEQLAEKYKNKLLFFAMEVYSNYYKRMPRTYGVPYILFFSDGYFYPNKRRRSFNELSYTIDNFYLTKCKDITYKNIENVYYNVFLKNKNKYNNLIIGYFDENSKDDIENFKASNKLLGDEKIGLCYICKDFKDIKNTNNTILKYIKSNIIVGYLNNNNTKLFLWENKNNIQQDLDKYKDLLIKNNIKLEKFNIKLYKSYEEFINNDLKLEYFIIDNKNNEYILNFLRNKNNLFFSFATNDEKTIYENNIIELINISNKSILSFYNLVIYNYTEINNNLNYIYKKGIYEIDQNLNITKEFMNYGEIKSKIIKELNINKTKYGIVNKAWIPEVKDENKISYENQDNPNDFFLDDLFFKILEKICVVLFTVVLTFAIFFCLYNQYYKNVDREQIYLIRNRR